MEYENTAGCSSAKSAGLREFAYWAALIVANAVCLTLMAILLFH